MSATTNRFELLTLERLQEIYDLIISSPPGTAAWGSIGAGTGVGSQTDLVTYLGSNYYPLSSNPAGYLTGVTATSPITSSGGLTPVISTLMNTNKLIGRSTAGTGVMEEITIGSGLSLSGGTLSTTATGGGISHGTATGTDTYAVTIAGVTSYADGDAYLIRFTNGNTTGCTLNINSLGAVTLYRNNDGPLIGGDIQDGAEMLCVYNSTLTVFQCIGTSPNTILAYVTNDDSVTITKGQPVYAFSGTGDRMTVKRAYNTSDATSAQTVGMVLSTSIAAGQKGLIMMQGLLDGLSILPTSTFADGDPIYLGATAGSITNVKPYAPNHLVYLGVVTTASPGSAGRMYVKVQNGYELDELHNVQAQTPSFKDTLWYDNTVSPAQWKTASISTILGYTPVPDTRTLTINGVAQDLSADRTWTVTTSPGVFTSSIGVDTNDLNASITSDGILTITPTTNLKITGLQGGAAGRSITLFNGSANYTLFIEHNSSSSSAANRIFNPDRNFIVILPQESILLTYRGDLSLWYTQRLGLATQFDDFSDFLVVGVSGNSGNLDCWGQLGAGTPNTAAFALRNGVLGMTLPATAGNYIHVGTATATTTSMGDAVAGVSRYMCTRVAIAQLPVVTTRDYELKLGFLLSKSASYLANSGAFWYLDRNFANWQCITTPSAAGQTIVDSGILATAGSGVSNFLHLGVVQLVGPSGGSVVANCCFFAVDSTGTISFGSRLQTTNLPTQGYDISADLFRVATGTSGNMLYIDYLGYKGNALR